MSAEHPHGGIAALSSPYARCQHGPQDGGGGEEGGGVGKVAAWWKTDQISKPISGQIFWFDSLITCNDYSDGDGGNDVQSGLISEARSRAGKQRRFSAQ